METLTLQTYLDGQWQDACELSFYEPEKGRYGRVSLEYNASYVAKNQSNLAARASMRYPIDFFPHEVLNHHMASLNLSGTEERLKTWGLLP